MAIKVFLCHLHSNRPVYAERHRNKDEIRGGGSGHSFTHNFLETEWGCLHKAKIINKTYDGKKRFCCLLFPVVYNVGMFNFRLMAQHIKMRKIIITFFFQPPKFHAAQDEAKQEDQL